MTLQYLCLANERYQNRRYDLMFFFSNFNAVDIPAGPLPIITTKNLLLANSDGLLTIIIFNEPNF